MSDVAIFENCFFGADEDNLSDGQPPDNAISYRTLFAIADPGGVYSESNLKSKGWELIRFMRRNFRVDRIERRGELYLVPAPSPTPADDFEVS